MNDPTAECDAKGSLPGLSRRAALTMLGVLTLLTTLPAGSAWARHLHRPDSWAASAAIAHLLAAAPGDDRAEDILASRLEHSRWPLPHWKFPVRRLRHHRLHAAPHAAAAPDKARLLVDPRLLAFLGLDAGGRPFVGLGAPILEEAARRVGEEVPLLSVPPLRICTRSPQPAVRAQAALALGWARDPGGEPFVAPLLQDPDASVRCAAARALGLMGDRAGAMPLIAALMDPQLSVRLAAASALGTLGDRSALAPLAGAARSHSAPLRRAALMAIAELGGPQATGILRTALADPALAGSDMSGSDDGGAGFLYSLARSAGRSATATEVAALVKDLGDPDPLLRRATLVALAASRSPAAVQALERALGDTDAQARGLAAQALGEVGNPSAAPALLDALAKSSARLAGADQAGPALVALEATDQLPRIRSLVESPDPTVATSALYVLGRLGTPGDVPLAVRSLGSPYPLVRASAAQALANLANLPAARIAMVSCAPPERTGILTDAQLAHALGRAAHVTGCGLTTLLDSLSDRSALVRSTAAEALGQLGDPRSFGQLFGAAKDPDPTVRDAARLALGRCGVIWADQPLNRALAEGSMTAARALATLGTPRTASRIATLLSSSNLAARGQAAGALGELFGRRPNASVPPPTIAKLHAMLADPDRGVRIQAALTLARLPGQESPLLAAAGHANPLVAPWFAAAAIRSASLRSRSYPAHAAIAKGWQSLVAAAAHPDPEVRRTALDALAWLGSVSAAIPPESPESISPSTDAWQLAGVRWSSLESHGPSLALAHLSDRIRPVREAAVGALVALQAPATLPALEARIEAGKWNQAVAILDRIDPPDPRAGVLAAAGRKAPDPRVRWAAGRLAERIERQGVAAFVPAPVR